MKSEKKKSGFQMEEDLRYSSTTLGVFLFCGIAYCIGAVLIGIYQ